MVTEAVREIDADQFDRAEEAGDVVVEFFATWCGACQRMAPVLDAIAAEMAGTVRFVKVNIDEHFQLADRFEVRSTPTLLMLRDGAVQHKTLVGAQPAATVREEIVSAFGVSTGPQATRADAKAWVPDDACTLPTAEQPFRLAEFSDLFRESLRGIERRDRTMLRLAIDAPATGRARDLAARESDCCSFFTFDFQRAPGGQVWMQVMVPAARADVLDGLTAQAAAAAGLGPLR